MTADDVRAALSAAGVDLGPPPLPVIAPWQGSPLMPPGSDHA